jgi:putative FmdB family regulatory protein
MPIFEYKCASCGSVSEFLVGVAQEAESIRCEQCGSSKMKKVFSSVSYAVKSPASGCGGCPAHEHAGSRSHSECEALGCPRAV